MAVYFLRLKTFSRAMGNRITHAAAYRAGERIRDQRVGKSYDYSHRQDVLDKGIVLPKELAGRTDTNWARDRAKLWNAAEHDDRSNLRLGREVLVLLPPELNQAQRLALVRRFSQNLANRYQNAVDFAVHEPRAGSDKRNHHAHLLMTTRQITPQGLGPRITLELNGPQRKARGLGTYRGDLFLIRERWAHITNEALHEAGLSVRIDHRSYKAQGLDREPKPVIPRGIFYQEKRNGLPSPAGDEIRARYSERVEARLKGRDALEQVVKRQNAEAHQRASARAKLAHDTPAWEEPYAKPSANLKEVTPEESAKRWKEYRANLKEVTPEESAKKWKEYRANLKEVTPEESAKKWQEYRAAKRERGFGAERSDDREHENRSRRRGLELEDDYGL